MAITKVIDPIPEAPQRGVDTQEQFDQKADAFLNRLETLDDDLNEWKDQCNQTQTEINQVADRVSIDRSVVEEAKAVCEMIGASNGYKGEWVSTNSYAKGDIVSYISYLWLSTIDDNVGNEPPSSDSWLQITRDNDCIACVGSVDISVNVGDPIYFDPDSGSWKKAETEPAQAIYDGLGRIVVAGLAKGLSGLTAGSVYYNNSGTLSTDTANDSSSDFVGVALGADKLLVSILRSDIFGVEKQSIGFQKLPSGLIIQWGSVTRTYNDPTSYIYFPVAFPNSCLCVVLCPNKSDFTGTLYSYGFTNSYVWVSGGDNDSTSAEYTFRFIAIGF